MNDKLKTRWFQTPTSSSSLRYATRFYMKVFQSLKADESLNLGAQLAPLKTNWYLTEKTAARWHKVFNYHSDAPQAFTYSAPAGVWALMQVLEDLGIKFSRIMHLRSHLLLTSPSGFEVNTHYTTNVRYMGARPLKTRSVALIFRSEVRDVRGHEIMQLEDELYVRGLPEDFVAQLSSEHLKVPATERHQIDLDNPVADQIPVKIGRRLGSQYGKLSGDLNPLHISSIGARLLGHSGSFIQGLCTANLILATLGAHWRQPVRSLTMEFKRPVPQPAKLTLICTLDQFSLIDAKKRVLVTGSYIC
jgi:hypothetical protein